MPKVSKKPVRSQRNQLETAYAQRRRRIIRQIRGEIAIFVSAPANIRSRDQEYPFQQNADLFYLTGFSEPEAALVLVGSSTGARSILYLRDRDAVDERWHGERLGIKRARRRFHIDEVRDIRNFKNELPELCLDAHTLHYAPGSNPYFDDIIWNSFKSSVGPRFQRPYALKDSRVLTAEMRFIKDREEIRAIRHAVDISARAFEWLIPRLREVTSEAHAAGLLESQFLRLGAHSLSFPTIVASGKNSTILHHRPQMQPLWRTELVLIDAGASYRGYAGDITRTVPVSGKFTKPQAELYDVVLAAHRAAISKAKPGSTLDDIHEAAVAAITKGLIDLKILRGKNTSLIAKGDYRRYFMHRTSHWLGIDVHDIAPVTALQHFVPAGMRPLVPGNVFTVEPGLYIDPGDESVRKPYRGIGIRLEDDILITSDGAEVLSERLPITRADIEAMMK